ncbi:MAG: metal-dependent hydrolase [Candidatus Cyclobacteriaceae bacterium M2_1C_046]
MDSLTQIALGAAVGEAVAGKKAGNKAVLWGAIAGTIPDLDVFIGDLMTTVNALDFHRGVTHSIFFAIILSPILGYGLTKVYKNNPTTWREWTLLFFLCFFTHALLDCFTTWGTQLFWPLDYRVAFKSIFVIDPLYTLPLLICLIWLMFLPKKSSKRRRLNTIGLSISTFYLFITLLVKHQANQVFEASFHRQDIPVERYETKPTPLNIILWAVTGEVENGYYMGYYSFLDDDKTINYFYFPKQHHLLGDLVQKENLQKLLDISDGWYTIEDTEKGVIYNDLRFGQRSGWETGEGQFVFAYHIYKENQQVVVKEVEKELGEVKEILKALWERVKGN